MGFVFEWGYDDIFPGDSGDLSHLAVVVKTSSFARLLLRCMQPSQSLRVLQRLAVCNLRLPCKLMPSAKGPPGIHRVNDQDSGFLVVNGSVRMLAAAGDMGVAS